MALSMRARWIGGAMLGASLAAMQLACGGTPRCPPPRPSPALVGVPTQGGSTGAALGLLVAGTATAVEVAQAERCRGASNGGGASLAARPASGPAEEASFPEATGRYRCTSEDGAEDVVLSRSPEAAMQVCRDLTAQSCRCAELED